jgi:hypothetical protein
MKKLLNVKSFVSVLLSFLMLMTSNSCKKDDEKDDLPELPPMEALLMDFSDFDDVPGDKKALQTYENFIIAASNVGFWNLFAQVVIAVPCLAYAEAFNHEAVYLGDNSWQWAYSVTYDQVTYSAKLISKRISNDEYKLKMLVSQSGTGGFTDFKWFEGTVRYDGTAAIWTLYQSPAEPAPVLTITWIMDYETDLYSIKYTDILADSEDYGSYIEHGVTDGTPYNAYYIISTTAGTINIEWDKTTKAGRIKAPEFLEDANWHCWDENLADAVCE